MKRERYLNLSKKEKENAKKERYGHDLYKNLSEDKK